MWIRLLNGAFFTTDAYLRGVTDAQRFPKHLIPNPFKPGPEHAQWRYGFDNEQDGYHDNIDLPTDVT